MPIIDEIIDKKALEHVLDAFNTASMARLEAEKKWDELYKAWRGITEKRNYQGKANVYDPEIANAVNAISVRIMGLLFAPYPFFDVIPQEERDKDNAAIIKELLAFQFYKKINIYEKVARLVPQFVVYGTGISKIVWRKTEKILEIRPGVKQPIVFYDDPDFIPRDIFSVYIDPRAIDIASADYIVDKYTVNEDHLKMMAKAGIYSNVENVQDIKGSEIDNPYVINRQVATGINVQVAEKSKRKKVELLEYWGKFDINNDGEDEDVIITVANRNTVVRIMENPFLTKEKPFVLAGYEYATDELYGISPLERALPLQYVMNDLHNQILDNKSLLLKKPMLVSDGAQVTIKQLEAYRKGEIIRVQGDISAIHEMPIEDHTQTGIEGLNLVRQTIQRSTGSSDPMLGVSTPGEQTATEIKTLVASGNSRIGNAARFFASGILAESLRKAYQYNQQFMTREKVIRIVGEEGTKYVAVSPDQIVGNYDFNALVFTELADKETQVEQMIKFLEISMKTAPDKVDVNILLKRIWEGLGFKDSEKIIKQEPTPEQMLSKIPAVAGAGANVPPPTTPSVPPMSVIPPIAGLGGGL